MASRAFAIALVMTAVLGAAIYIGHYLGNRFGVGTVIVLNSSSQSIVSGTLHICKSQYSFSNLASGGTAAFPHRIDCESSYSLEVKFTNEETRMKTAGYITPGITDVVALFVIEDSGIWYSQGNSGIINTDSPNE